MTIKIAWDANPESDIKYYEIYRAIGLDDTYLYVGETSSTEYEDPRGTVNYHYYKIRAVTTSGVKGDYSIPVQASETASTEYPENGVTINHDYPTPDYLAYTDEDGVPIEDAEVRIFYKTDYEIQNLSNPVGFTTTDENGQWEGPITVSTGFTYTVEFRKPNYYGPDTEEVDA